MSTEQFCTFLLDGHVFGTPVAKVQEVAPVLPMTRVPLAPDVVRGLVNRRGQIVPAIDLRRRLDFPDRDGGGLPVNVVVRAEDGPVSLLVDEIGDVVEVEEETFEVPPATLTGVARMAVQRVYKLPGYLLLALDIERVVDLSDLIPARGGPPEIAQSSSATPRRN